MPVGLEVVFPAHISHKPTDPGFIITPSVAPHAFVFSFTLLKNANMFEDIFHLAFVQSSATVRASQSSVMLEQQASFCFVLYSDKADLQHNLSVAKKKKGKYGATLVIVSEIDSFIVLVLMTFN